MKKSLYIIALSLALFSCKESKTEEVEQKDNGLITVSATQFKSSGMEIASPTEQDFDVTVKASGKIDVPPQNRAKVNTFMGGYVKSTTLLVGNRVTKGQALLTLQNTEFLDIQKEYMEVAEQLNFLKSEYDRQKTLYDEKITSQKNYLKAESEYKRAKATHQSLRAKLLLLNINPRNVERGILTSTITIFSPITGDIVIMNANIGMYVAPSDVILEIVDTDHLHLELAVFEKDILNVKIGQKIHFKVPEASKEVFNADVHLVGKSIEGNDRTINIHGHLDDAIKQKLLTGMFVESEIIIDSKKGLAIPAEALVTENNKNFVLLVKNEKNGYSFKKVSVTIGEKSENFVEILPNTAINASSRLLTKGVFDLVN
ncbi:efflux RND transporter periplasmic adaptor subunit [Flavobacterium glaciei]|uniref:Cobalt-zinc-cadmium efflux system membrane fusion protein n=1 Tax=Flavobacterium glaciei TaxID=386300 RepID=A0A562PPN6_9FLAO|nr:efflux RND transporter periplasmic adaptor subunit [Flavobacterium glaciei]RDI53492.1 cobalt-zinc-cadmium efflux system membrane fusion protein [Flavobacterium glaciei]TWI46394.1 cobalt-zinc-cadmium efflux system membrane fusion protein [Flavobacterium glaciei]